MSFHSKWNTAVILVSNTTQKLTGSSKLIGIAFSIVRKSAFFVAKKLLCSKFFTAASKCQRALHYGETRKMKTFISFRIWIGRYFPFNVNVTSSAIPSDHRMLRITSLMRQCTRRVIFHSRKEGDSQKKKKMNVFDVKSRKFIARQCIKEKISINYRNASFNSLSLSLSRTHTHSARENNLFDSCKSYAFCFLCRALQTCPNKYSRATVAQSVFVRQCCHCFEIHHHQHPHQSP